MRFGGTVELHLHMDICMSFEAVASLDPAVDFDTYRREFVGPSRFDSLTAFLASTDRHVALLQTEHGLRTCMRDLRAQLAADNALHAEPRFAPLRHIEGDVTTLHSAAHRRSPRGIRSCGRRGRLPALDPFAGVRDRPWGRCSLHGPRRGGGRTGERA